MARNDKEIEEGIAEYKEEYKELFAFEKYCAACDNYNKETCPFFGEVFSNTEWKKIKCDKFWD